MKSLIIFAAVPFLCALPAEAGKSGFSGSGFKYSAARTPTPSPARFSASGRSQGLRSSANTLSRRSLLSNAASQPSEKVTKIIREQERRSGPGWIGTAFLIALLSRHDLSSADRGWIQEQIKTAHDSGDNGTDSLLMPVKTPVQFSYSGLQPSYTVGDMVRLTVKANRLGKTLPVNCAINGTQHAKASNASRISLDTTEQGTQILNCEAGGRTDRRLLRIVPKNQAA